MVFTEYNSFGDRQISGYFIYLWGSLVQSQHSSKTKELFPPEFDLISIYFDLGLSNYVSWVSLTLLRLDHASSDHKSTPTQSNSVFLLV